MTIYAFPSGHNPKTGRQEEGMTLRDYFAARAMEAYLGKIPLEVRVDAESLSQISFVMADAMLKARDE